MPDVQAGPGGEVARPALPREPLLGAATGDVPRLGPTLLLVDDHADLRDPLAEYLTQNGYRVLTAADGAEARLACERDEIDLVLLDIMMPGEDGFSVCQALQRARNVPVIFLTARADDVDRIVGLEIGADDYVVKPFNPRELLARITAVMRRASGAGPGDRDERRPDEQTCFRFSGFTLQTRARELIDPNGVVLALGATEYRLLIAFLERPHRVLTREQLLEILHGVAADVFDRSIDTQISRLRRKLEQDPRNPRIIKTVWGGGYTLASAVEAR